MAFKFECVFCGQRLSAESNDIGRDANCPSCGQGLIVPPPSIKFTSTPTTPPSQSTNAGFGGMGGGASSGFSSERPSGPVTTEFVASGRGLNCPTCWKEFGRGDVMHIAVHESLRGDPVLGRDEMLRFSATEFSGSGHALDPKGVPTADVACPFCRRRLPQGFLKTPYHLISLVGDQSSGKSYYLAILSKILPATLFRDFGLICQDADPTGNAPLNEMRNTIFSARSPEGTRIAKTAFEGEMYVRISRHGRQMAFPRPFSYTLQKAGQDDPVCSFVIYDNAGEHFQPGVNIQESPGASHIAAASLILFLFDPLNSVDFRRAIKTTDHPQFEKIVSDKHEVILSEMKVRIRTIKNELASNRIDTPVAFMVGKMDSWEHLLGDTPLENPIQSGQLCLDVVQRNSKRVRELLLKHCPVVLAAVESLSTQVCFFGISPFGHSPAKLGPGNYAPDPEKLSPVQVEVPFLWFLSCRFPGLLPVQSAPKAP